MNISNDGGVNCASDGIYIDIGGTDSLMLSKYELFAAVIHEYIIHEIYIYCLKKLELTNRLT